MLLFTSNDTTVAYSGINTQKVLIFLHHAALQQDSLLTSDFHAISPGPEAQNKANLFQRLLFLRPYRSWNCGKAAIDLVLHFITRDFNNLQALRFPQTSRIARLLVLGGAEVQSIPAVCCQALERLLAWRRLTQLALDRPRNNVLSLNMSYSDLTVNRPASYLSPSSVPKPEQGLAPFLCNQHSQVTHLWVQVSPRIKHYFYSGLLILRGFTS